MAEGTAGKTKSTFERLLAKDVSAHVEKKGKFSYLSWSYAVADLCRECPTATWEVMRFPLPDAPHLLVPYCQTPTGFFVEVAVTVEGITRSQVHPVLDERNQVIKAPTAFQINTSTQRALVKAIGLHGLGLNIYAGEDLPLGDDGEDEPAPRKQPHASVTIQDDLRQAIGHELDRMGKKGSERTRLVVEAVGHQPETVADLQKALAVLKGKPDAKE
jgi:hypothetical protein